MSSGSEKNPQPVKFRKVGAKEQHEVNLFGIATKPADFSDSGNAQVSALTEIYDDAVAYLQQKGIADPTGLFHVVDDRVERWIEGVHPAISAMPLVAAIEQRDKMGGQTGEFLAAMIVHRGGQIQIALNRFRSGDKSEGNLAFIVETALMMQGNHFQLYLLERVHSQYSAGKARTNEANEERNLATPFQSDAEDLFRQLRAQSHSKERCYELIAERLKQSNPGKKTPKAGTIKGWLKARKDLP